MVHFNRRRVHRWKTENEGKGHSKTAHSGRSLILLTILIIVQLIAKRAFYSNKELDENDENPLLTPIDFGVLVTVGSDDKAKGGIGIFAASLGVGVQGEATERKESLNRIKFQLLAKLPQQE